MKLKNKKELAARTLNVGKERILFVKSRIDEIKEAITKQDIRDLYMDGAIKIKEIKGRKKKVKKSKKRGQGKIKKRVKRRKQKYVKYVRKLRKIVNLAKRKGEITNEEARNLRIKIRNKEFKSAVHLKKQIKEIKK